jgi:hypothetical protein
MFNWKKPTVQLLGRWQPWHDGHTALFKEAVSITGQVCIMIRDVNGVDDNPFDSIIVKTNITNTLKNNGFTYGVEYIIIEVPNITNISYGRDVGYTFTQHDLGKEIHSISATDIRAKLREEGKLASKS